MHKKVIRDTVYYYTSVRENGRVKTIYLGRSEKDALEREKQLRSSKASSGPSVVRNFFNSRLPIYFSILFFIAIGLFFLRGYYVGYVTIGGLEAYSPGEKLTGTINLTFMSEELYPKDSIVEIALGNQTLKMSLAEFLSRSEGQIDEGAGVFYISGTDLSEEGEGFGLTGEKILYPELDFSYYLTCYGGNEKYEMIIDGKCSFLNPYANAIPENLTACSLAIVPQSVYLRNDSVDENWIRIRLENNSVIAETDYAETVIGMGKDFVGAQERAVAFPFEKVDLNVPDEPGEYALALRIIYNEKILKETTKKITVSPLPGAEEMNITLPTACDDNDKDGYNTCKQPVDCDDNDPKVNPGAEEICGNLIDEDCNGFDEPCTKLSDIISSKKLIFVKNEVTKEIEKKKQARIIIKLKDVSRKAVIENEITPDKEVKNFISATVSELEMINLVNTFSENEIELIQLDHPIRLVLEDVINQTGVNLVWDLNATGKRQTVCIVDSGIDYNHPSLSSNYIGGYDFINNDSDPMDDYGHGTYVSGIVAGIAKDSKILSAKVFGNDGVGYESDILAGIDYCIQNKNAYNISVMLMSFGGGIYNTSCYCDSNFVASEANFAVSQGIFAVAASGNDGEPYLKAPACGSNVTSVGAVDKNDNVASFTNIEPLLDVLAPGVEIESAKMGGGFETRNGTSASAAVVAGVASMLLENESLAPLDLQYRLRSTGFIVTQNGTGYARIDAYNALLNKITNTPSGQEGTQCEGRWEGYEPLAWECTSAECPEGCQNGYCTRTCFGYGWSVNNCIPDCCTDSCVKDSCSAECASSGDCTSRCSGTSRGTSCNTGCGSCSCNWDDCVDDCSGSQHYTACDTGSCTSPTCSTSYCGASCNQGYEWEGDGDAYYCKICSGSSCEQNQNDGQWCDYVNDAGSEHCNGVGNQACHLKCSSSGNCDQEEQCGCWKGYCGANCELDGDCTADSCSGGCPGCLYNDNYCTADPGCTCAVTQYDPDSSSTYCTGCSQTWGIGGEGGNCCGDDSSEYVKTETSGTDAPSPYNDNSGTTCCGPSTDCAESGTDVCTATATAAGSIPNKAYCGASSTWYGGDAGDTQCTAIVAAGRWNVGGSGDCTGSCLTNCCGDDNSENYRIFIDYLGQTYGYQDWGASQQTCCDVSTDQVNYNSQCVAANPGVAVATGYSGHDKNAYPYYSDVTYQGWLDCDGHSTWATGGCSNVCTGGWVYYGDATGEKCDTSCTAGSGCCSESGQENYGCCGDDSGENKVSFREYLSDMEWSAGSLCCDSVNDNVNYNNQCVTETYAAVLTGYSGNDKYAAPYQGGWLDCDANSWYDNWCVGLCAGNTNSGESSGPGEYTGLGTGGCCGDDSGENGQSFANYGGTTYGSQDWGASQKACCDSSNDQINYNSACVTSNTAPGGAVATGYSVHDKYAYPYTTGWLELDGASSWPGYYGSNVCGGSGWVNLSRGDSAGENCGTAGSTQCGAETTYGCCGDDSGEYYLYRLSYADQVGGNTATNTSDYACCDAATDCVYGGTCYTTTSWYNLGSAGWNYCNGASGWLNTDRHISYCDGVIGANHWNIGGDVNIEDSYYTSGCGSWPSACCEIGLSGIPSQLCCCGDDPGENYRTRVGYTDAPSGYETDPNDKACCDTGGGSGDSVKGGVCVAQGTAYGTIPTRAWAYWGGWYGGDCCGAGECEAILGVSGRWAVGGEVATGNTTCCGDDSGENYIYCQAASGFPHGGQDCTASDNACCDTSTDCANTTGDLCAASSTSVFVDGDGNGDTDYCNAGTWYDCYNDGNCPSGQICNASYDCAPGDVVDGGSNTTCGPSDPCLYIKNSTGAVKARFDDNGNIDVKGNYLSSQTTTLSCSNCFQVKNSTGQVVLYINSTGDMVTKGTFTKTGSPSPSGNNDYIVKDSSGTVVGLIDAVNGSLYFKNQLHYNSNF